MAAGPMCPSSGRQAWVPPWKVPQASGPGNIGQAPVRSAAGKTDSPEDEEDEALAGRFQKSYEVCLQQLGPDGEVTQKLQTDLQTVRARLQSGKPALAQLQSAQTRLQKLQAQLLKEHEEYEVIVLEIEALQHRKEEKYKRGTATRKLNDEAKAEVERLAAIVAAK